MKSAVRNLVLVTGILLVGIILTLILNTVLLHLTKENRGNLQFAKVATNLDEIPTRPFIPVAKPQTVANTPVSLKGLKMPEFADAPPPVNSKKSNTVIENLLFAMKFYAQAPKDNDTIMTVSGWDAITGYYLTDQGTAASAILALARNARYLLVLKLYQEYFPTTHYFDDDAVRVEEILGRIIEPEHLSANITDLSFISIRVPDKIYYDLMMLNKVTGNEKYRDAALFIAEKHSTTVIRQSTLIKNSRDRTSKIGMFGDAAMSYVAGVEIGDLDLQGDASLVMKDLITELWADTYNLLYTSASVGQFGNITNTFITTDQMHAVSALIKYAEASGDNAIGTIAYTIIESLADGSNPVCDQPNHGFFRRYNGDSRSPHKDYKLSEDHIAFLEALIEINALNNGKYDEMLDYFFETYEILLYDTYSNGIYLEYEINWNPKVENNIPLVSVDAILDYVLVVLEDKKYRVDKSLGNA